MSIAKSWQKFEEQRAILRDVYEATGGAEWKNAINWLSSEPLSEWYGVTVGEGDVVVDLALESNNLKGENCIHNSRYTNKIWNSACYLKIEK